MPLPRMTTRRWMIAVACAALCLATVATLWRRAERFQALAQSHKASVEREAARAKHWEGEIDDDRMMTSFNPSGKELSARELAVIDWHVTLVRKYRRAGRRPWLPVPPDPPPP